MMGRPFSEFCKNGHEMAISRRKTPGGKFYCSICLKENQRKWVQQYGDEWNLKHKERLSVAKKFANIKRLYKISREQYIEMFESQAGKCAICGTSEKELCIDHCHNTGNIRGLLCHPCNRGIGLLKENTEFLSKAIKYLD